MWIWFTTDKVKSFFFGGRGGGQCLNSTLKTSTDLITETNQNISPQFLI